MKDETDLANSQRFITLVESKMFCFSSHWKSLCYAYVSACLLSWPVSAIISSKLYEIIGNLTEIQLSELFTVLKDRPTIRLQVQAIQYASHNTSETALGYIRQLFQDVERYCLDIVIQDHNVTLQLAQSIAHLCDSVESADVISLSVYIFLTSERVATHWLMANILWHLNDENIVLSVLLHLQSIYLTKENCNVFQIVTFCKWLDTELLSVSARAVLDGNFKTCFWHSPPKPPHDGNKNWRRLPQLLPVVDVGHQARS